MAAHNYKATVTFYKGVPFDNSYQHSLNPQPVDLKKKWLDENVGGKEYKNLMFVKLNTINSKGVIRLSMRSEDAEQYNYVHVDTGTGVKYFAFILGCVYINDGPAGSDEAVYEFAIQKDLIMSHMVSSNQFVPCPIVRHHSTLSTFNDPLVPEPFQGGKIVPSTFERIDNIDTSDCYLVMIYVPGEQIDFIFKATDAYELIQGVPNGCKGLYFPMSSVRPGGVIKEVTESGGQVVALYPAPKILFGGGPSDGGAYFNDGNINKTIRKTTIFTENNIRPWGLPLRNNKIMYYPYNFLRLFNDTGTSMDLRFEEWKSENGSFSVEYEGTALLPVSVTIRPVDYGNCSGLKLDSNWLGAHYDANPRAQLTIGNYPIGSWITDSYSQAVGQGKLIDFFASSKEEFTDSIWRYVLSGNSPAFSSSKISGAVTQGASNIASDAIAQGSRGAAMMSASGASDAAALSGGLRIAGSSAAGAVGSAAAGVVGSALATVAEFAVESVIDSAKTAAASYFSTDEICGNVNAGNSNYSNNRKWFHKAHMCPTVEECYALDSIFQRYGYAQGGKVAKPDPYGRDLWVYIETAGNCFKPTGSGNGLCNTTEVNAINNIFRSGITLWAPGTNSLADIFNYDRDNGADPIPMPNGKNTYSNT